MTQILKANEKCNHKFESDDGTTIICHLEKNHLGCCQGYYNGTKTYFPKEFDSAEQMHYADYITTLRCEMNS